MYKSIDLMTGRASNNIPPSLRKVWAELDEKQNKMSGQKTWTGKAIVARGPLDKDGWKMEEVTTRELKGDELLIEMVASGICHTDIMCGSGEPDSFFVYPRVLGHEGMGA